MRWTSVHGDTWESLSDAERVAMNEAYDGEPLWSFLNALVPAEDAPYWNRKWRHVPTATAIVESLVRRGYIDIFDLTDDPHAEVPLNLEDAMRVIAEQSNWWEYDPDDVTDEDAESGADAEAREHDRGTLTEERREYLAYASEHGFELGRNRIQPPRRSSPPPQA